MHYITDGGRFEMFSTRSFPYLLDNAGMNNAKPIAVSSSLYMKVVSICVPEYSGLNSGSDN